MNTKTLAQKIQEMRLWFSKQTFKKSGNNLHLKFQYLELQDFLPALNEYMANNDLFSVTSFKDDQVTLTILDSKNNESISWNSPLIYAKMSGGNPIQELGATITYMRRYMLFLALEVAVPDEVDTATETKKMSDKNAKANFKEEVRLELSKAESREDLEALLEKVTTNKSKLGMDSLIIIGDIKTKLQGVN